MIWLVFLSQKQVQYNCKISTWLYIKLCCVSISTYKHIGSSSWVVVDLTQWMNRRWVSNIEFSWNVFRRQTVLVFNLIVLIWIEKLHFYKNIIIIGHQLIYISSKSEVPCSYKNSSRINSDARCLRAFSAECPATACPGTRTSSCPPSSTPSRTYWK